jgi:hypothetical protein
MRLLGMMAVAAALGMAGWVSDAGCGAKHTQAGGADCVRKCLKGGQDIGHPVFVTDGDKTIWVIANPSALKGQEGLDASKGSLRVVNVTSLEEAR